MAALATGAALLLVELGHRLWLRAEGTPYDRAAVHRRLVRGLDTTAAFARPEPAGGEAEVGSFPVLHPFYGAEKYADAGGVLRFFERGHDAEVYTVVVLGGSVAAFWALDQDRAFARLLEADPRLGGRPVRVLMFAHASYKQPQQVGRLAWLLAHGHRPDAVVNLDGFNEVALSYDNAQTGTHPMYPSPPVWGAVLRDRTELSAEALDLLLGMRALQNEAALLVHRSLHLRLTASSLLGRWLETRVDALNARRSELRETYLAQALVRTPDPTLRRQRSGADFRREDAAVVALGVASWFEGSLSLRAMCAARGIHYVHVLQPTLLDAGSKPLTERERGFVPGPPNWQRGVELGYPRLRERGRELAERGVVFLDASGVFADVEDTLYFDACHFGAAGNRVLAATVARVFLETLPDR